MFKKYEQDLQSLINEFKANETAALIERFREKEDKQKRHKKQGELMANGNYAFLNALSEFITPIIGIVPQPIAKAMYEEDVIAQTVYLYHHFKQITSESKQSCQVELPCQSVDFNYKCLEGPILEKKGL